MAETTPNPAPWKTWLLKAAIAVGVLVLVLGIPVLVLHSQAEGEWRQLEAAHIAKGDSLDWQSIIPPEVPEEKNFAYTPAMVHLNKRTIDPDGRIRFRSSHTNGYPEWIIKRRVWVKMGWRRGYQYGCRPPIASLWHRLDNGLHRTPSGDSTNHPPSGARAQAEDILAMLKPFDPVINELIQARKGRPHIRFNVRYERHLEALLPHLSAMKNTVVTHRVRGIVRLALDDTAGALEDLEMCLFLCRGLSIEPGWLISHLVALATHNISMQLVFNGLSTRKWNETQLAVIEKELSQFDWLALYHYAMRGTRNETLAFFQEMAGNRLRTHKKFDKFVMTDVPKTVLWVPGALQENQNKIVRLYDERVFALVNLKTRTVDVRLAKHFVIRRFESKHLNEVLASDLFYGQENLALKTARAQVANDLARLAVALERHRRAEGDYPEKLAALAPRFLPKIPHDVMNGKPLNYKRLNDDYLLYSVGQNLRDDGGLIVEKDYHAGDIRWFAKPKPQPKPKAE